MSPTPRIPVPFHFPFTRADVIAAGFTKHAITGWLQRGEVVQLTRGLFSPTAFATDPRGRLIYATKAVVHGHVPVPILGAALIHDLWTPPKPHASLTIAPRAHEIPEDHLHRMGRLLVPDKAWTAMQLARWQRLEGALISLDRVVQLGVDVAVLQRILEAWEMWPGAKWLHLAVAHVNALSGSALESWSRGLMIRNRLPAPVLQKELLIDGRKQYPDFLWEKQRLIGEADGREKYSDVEELAREKRRQSRLQSAGFVVYRWGWAEVIGNHRPWLEGLRLALSRSAP